MNFFFCLCIVVVYWLLFFVLFVVARWYSVTKAGRKWWCADISISSSSSLLPAALKNTKVTQLDQKRTSLFVKDYVDCGSNDVKKNRTAKFRVLLFPTTWIRQNKRHSSRALPRDDDKNKEVKCRWFFGIFTLKSLKKKWEVKCSQVRSHLFLKLCF